MSFYPKDKKLPPLGALQVDYTEDIHRPAGDPLNADSFKFPLLFEKVKGAIPANVVKSEKFSEEYLQCYVDACEKLRERGAIGIITSCGFLLQVQQRLQDKVKIPVATSSLLQLPFVLSIIPSNKHVGVLTYDGDILGDTHLDGIGIPKETRKRITIVGAHKDGPLHGVIRHTGIYEHDALEKEMVQITKELLERDPLVAAIVLECTQMPPFSQAVQKASHLPVYNAITMIDHFYSGIYNRQVLPDDDVADGLKMKKRGAKEANAP